MTHVTSTPQAQPSPSTEPWPDGVIARYLTVAGTTVDVRGGGDGASMTCLGCGDGNASYVERRARELAQAHAEKCRALPRPTAS